MIFSYPIMLGLANRQRDALSRGTDIHQQIEDDLDEPRREDFDTWDDYICAKELYDYDLQDKFWEAMREEEGCDLIDERGPFAGMY